MFLFSICIFISTSSVNKAPKAVNAKSLISSIMMIQPMTIYFGNYEHLQITGWCNLRHLMK